MLRDEDTKTKGTGTNDTNSVYENGNHRRGQVVETEIDRSQLAVCSLYTKCIM